MKNVFVLQGGLRGPFAGSKWVFKDGEQWVVMGPNGSGKTLLCSMLGEEIPTRSVSLEMPDDIEGQTAFLTFGQQQGDASGSWLQARWHDSICEDEKTVADFLSFNAVNEISPFEVRDEDSDEQRRFDERSATLDKMLHIAELRDRLLVQVSNGEMRRVLLAMALLKFPRLLVLDDPFAGLDPQMRSLLKKLLCELAADGVHLVLALRTKDEIPPCATNLLELDSLRIRTKRKLTTTDLKADEKEEDYASFLRKEKSAKVSLPPVIEMRGVSIELGGKRLFDNFDWIVRRGERWLVVGPNGCGKSTLLSLVSGDNPLAYRFDINVFGKRRGEVTLWETRRRIGEVSPELQCHRDTSQTCLETVLSGRFTSEGAIARATPAARTRAKELLKRFGMQSAEKQLFGSLSAGEQRVVLLARALCPNPDLLLLDEPCLNLDANTRRQVLAVIEDVLKSEPELTILCVAHRREDAPRNMDRLLNLAKHGK